jgi:RNA-directed DNA polymerase
VTLGALLLQLQPLLGDPWGNFAELTRLLERHRDLAEYEVARHWVAKSLGPRLWDLVHSEDPRERQQAVEAARLLCSRAGAAKILRHLVKDPITRVAQRARSTIYLLGITDVALPNTHRLRQGQAVHPRMWSPGGWSYGAGRAWGRRPSQQAPDLATLGLPALPDVDALAAHLGLADAHALRRLMRPGSATGAPYVDFEIPKRTGGTRRISAPRAPLRAAQREILRTILDRIPTHEAAHGFVRGRSTVTNARPHLGAAILVKLDLKDFFPTVHYHRVRGLFEHYGYSNQVSGALAALCTRRPVMPDGHVAWPGVLPQGAPTSPTIANLVSRRLDERLTGLARKLGATYTRYADDLTFSFGREPERGLGRFFWWVDQIVQQEGFSEHSGKRRVLRRSTQQRVTGIVVNEELHVPRAARRRFRAILHNCKTKGLASQARGRDDFRDYLLGFASYVHMVQPKEGQALLAEVRALLAQSP